MRKVADILCHKPRPFNFIEPGARVEDALNILGAVNMSYLVVMHEQDFKGIFCEHDFLKNVAMRGWDPKVCTVEDTMTRNLPVLGPDDSLEECIELIKNHQLHFVPVFDNHRFVGIVTPEDIVCAMAPGLEEVLETMITEKPAEKYEMMY